MHQNEIFERALSHQTNKFNINLCTARDLVDTFGGVNRASVREMKVWPKDNPVTLSCFVSRRFDRPGDRTGTTSPVADGDPD